MYVYAIDYSIIKHLCARLAATCIAIDFGSFPSMEAATQMQKEECIVLATQNLSLLAVCIHQRGESFFDRTTFYLLT